MANFSTLKPGIAAKRIEAFERRYGKAHLYLAYHAAIALVLTPKFLYRLRLNFQQDSLGRSLNIPWFAIADLLLSSLCNEIGYELYQMDLTVRDELLNRLAQDANFGQIRIKNLSEFLLDYIQPDLQSSDPDLQIMAKAQRWVALAYTRPHKTAHEIAVVFSSLNLGDIAEIFRLEALLQALVIPLNKYPSLFTYIRGIAAFARGNLAQATDLLKQLVGNDRQIRVLGMTLPLFTEIQNTLNTTPPHTNHDYRRANLRGQSFVGQNLSNADFSYADIRGADFSNAVLTGANFSHTIAGLALKPWAITPILCAVVLSTSSFIGAILIGSFLENYLVNPPTEALFSFAVCGLFLFTIIVLIILYRGIEATIGAFALFSASFLYFITAIAGLTTNIGFPVWSVEGISVRILFAVAGFVTLGVGIAASRLGVLSFLSKWASRWIGGIAISMITGGFLAMQHLLGIADQWKIVGIADTGFRAWLEKAINTDTNASSSAAVMLLVGLLGVILTQAISTVLVKSINKAFAILFSLGSLLFWLTFLTSINVSLHSIEVFLIAFTVSNLGIYTGWRSLATDRKYIFIHKAASAFVSLWMKGTNFQEADLTDVNFSSAVLRYANFSNACLTRVSWFRAQALDLAYFTESYLKLPKVQELVITGHGKGKVLDHLVLRGINLSEFDLTDASFIGTDLSDANLQGANLLRAKLIKTQFDGTNLTGAYLTGAYVQDCYTTSSTKLNSIECGYIYTELPTLKNPNPTRKPEDKEQMFESGDFADFIQSAKV